jgi:hypothetical protein
MVKPPREPERTGVPALRRRHRASVLVSLVGICENLERLQVTREARLACRDVAALLTAARLREKAPPARRRK